MATVDRVATYAGSARPQASAGSYRARSVAGAGDLPLSSLLGAPYGNGVVQPSALIAELQWQRRHVIATLEGLSPGQLLAPVPPTTWAPAAALHHLALDVERWWFQAIVAGDRDAWAYFDENPNGAWAIGDGVDVLALYQSEAARSDDTISIRDLDSTPDAWPEFLGPVQTLGQIVIHVIGETAAHAGQLDIVRETIDGHRFLVMN